MRYSIKKRNTPIATLIRNFINKKSGKVSVSREEIQRRFKYLDWKDQKKIMNAFLNSGKKDREWAYSQLLDNWDNSFIPKVKELWEIYHEYKCSWSVIRYFPLDYIKEHMDDFDGERDYFFICLRLAKDKNYVIERDRLSKTDYLAVLYHTGRNFSNQDAHDTLFGIIHDCCLPDYCIMKLENVNEVKYKEVVTPANFREVCLAIYYLQKLEKIAVVCLFEIWNQMVEESICNSQDFRSIKRDNYYSDYKYDQRRIGLAKIYAYQSLSEKFKFPSDPTIEQMRQLLEQRTDFDPSVIEYDTENPLPF